MQGTFSKHLRTLDKKVISPCVGTLFLSVCYFERVLDVFCVYNVDLGSGFIMKPCSF